MSYEFWVPIIVALISAIISFTVAARQHKADQLAAKQKAERDKPDIAEKYEQMVTRQATKIIVMQQEIDELRIEVRELKQAKAEQERCEEEWRAGIRLLLDQLVANHLTPVWIPDNDQDDRRAARERPSRPRPR